MLKKVYFQVCFFTLCIQHFSRGNPLSGDLVRYAKKDEFPYVVSVSQKSDKDRACPENFHLCSGTLLTAKHVLTAAHCVKNRRYEDVVVKLDRVDLVHSEKYEVKKWITYDEWAHITTNKTMNDIAILVLATCVKSNIKPAILANISEAKLEGKKAMVAGRGLVKCQSKTRYLMTGEVTVLTARNCLTNLKEDVVSQIKKSPHMFLCTTAKPPIYVECGDSGGPLIVGKNQIIGVTKGMCFKGSVEKKVDRQNSHVSVEYYKDFINDVVECENQNPGCCIVQ